MNIKKHIPILCSLVRKDNLTLAEYAIIEQFFDILQIYKKMILKFETRTCKLSDTIPEILSLLIKLDKFEEGVKVI